MRAVDKREVKGSVQREDAEERQHEFHHLVVILLSKKYAGWNEGIPGAFMVRIYIPSKGCSVPFMSRRKGQALRTIYTQKPTIAVQNSCISPIPR